MNKEKCLSTHHFGEHCCVVLGVSSDNCNISVQVYIHAVQNDHALVSCLVTTKSVLDLQSNRFNT